MRVKAHSCRRARLAFLLGGTAAIVLSAGKPARAISINDSFTPAQVIDTTNQFPNVVSLFFSSPGGSPSAFWRHLRRRQRGPSLCSNCAGA
jgi:hypothetical protein